MRKSGGKAVRYNKWGYIFLIPFIVVYVVFQLVPLITTIYNSFFENYMSGLTQIGPNFVGFENYEKSFLLLYESLKTKKPSLLEKAGMIQFFETSFELICLHFCCPI